MLESHSAALAVLAEARAVTDARLAWRAARLREVPGGRDGEALAYALETPGKRVRPALVLASYRAAGGSHPGIAGVAAAVEVVHTYSLVHDDLPCMDDDAQRRGRPTVHVRFDVPTATRAGFRLVPVAIQELVSGLGELGLSSEGTGALAGRLLEASGIRGMVAGQWLDLAAEGAELALEDLAEIHRLKTGALIEVACALGGLAAMASEAVVDTLARYGQEVGIAFQIADDLLDATGTSEELGKTAGRDATLAKVTYVSVLGIEGARQAAGRHGANARAVLREGGVASGTLDALADYIVERRS
ncbi:MAG TPA: polyprenyl synthetase family protein [Gemmatimonadales bacterium]|nr:polyprenyl synthetase family protein [Gemmatimonadales bacterium]